MKPVIVEAIINHRYDVIPIVQKVVAYFRGGLLAPICAAVFPESFAVR